MTVIAATVVALEATLPRLAFVVAFCRSFGLCVGRGVGSGRGFGDVGVRLVVGVHGSRRRFLKFREVDGSLPSLACTGGWLVVEVFRVVLMVCRLSGLQLPRLPRLAGAMR
jgi:hypothetical protein